MRIKIVFNKKKSERKIKNTVTSRKYTNELKI